MDEHSLEITRMFDAPREKVWEACTKLELLQKWWGQPKDAVMPFSTLNFQIGGSLHYKVEIPDKGIVVWGKTVYKEITPPERLVFEDYYSDEAGNLNDTPELPKSLITLTLKEVGEKTQLTVRHEGIGVGVHSVVQYRVGWSESLDRLQGIFIVK